MEENKRIADMIQRANLKEKYQKLVDREPDTLDHLVRIMNNYGEKTTNYSQKCDATARQFLMLILSDEQLKVIHSARYRVKSVESLIGKYIKKKAFLPEIPSNNYDIEKYRTLNGDNYYKIITDLIGIRILICYRQQWKMVHDWIWKNFYAGEESYIQNWLENYPSDSTKDYIVQRPIVYYRDEKERLFYKMEGQNVFDFRSSKEGYSSIHYLIWYDGKYVELQVRTIYDEAWGECTHDLVYKCKDRSLQSQLEELSVCLATQTQAAEMIAEMMYKKTAGVSFVTDDKEDQEPEVKKSKQGYADLKKRIDKMNAMKDNEKVFDGSVDGLL